MLYLYLSRKFCLSKNCWLRVVPTHPSHVGMLGIKPVTSYAEVQDANYYFAISQVTRMLPGGMCVLGVFVTGPGDVFSESASQSKLATMLQGLTRTLSKKTSLYGNSPSTEKLCIHLVSSTNK